jgi:diguanylate cyclase (GGDEF)-like protein
MGNKKGYSLLIIDDSEMIRNHIKSVLSTQNLFSNYYEASDGLQGFKELIEKKPDLVIVDLVMPQFDGFYFLKMKNSRQELTNIPVIVLTSIGDIASKVQGLEKGANDYIVKPFDVKELLARVKVHLNIKILQDELKQKNDLLHKLSITDELTHIYNRRYFIKRLKEEFHRALRYSEKLALIIMDIDNFKKINDTYGHQTGDKILYQVAKIMKQQLRGCDVLGRYGGEEFIILLPYTDFKGAFALSERIRNSIEQNTFKVGRKKINVTISAGIVSYPEYKAESYEKFIKKADEGLYLAKKSGKNRTCFVYEQAKMAK